MSSHIIDEIRAVRIPKELHKHAYKQDVFILCELGGDNNVINSRTNRRARSWSAVAVGEPWQVIGEICKSAGEFEGGMLKFTSGRGTPEGYIRKCRKALETAETYRQGGELGVNLIIRFNEKEKENGAKWQYQELVKKIGVSSVEQRYGETEDVFRFTDEQLALWIDATHGRGWRNAEVMGPREV